MKLNNLDITTMARQLFRHKKRTHRPKLMHPRRDWLLGVLVGIVIIMIMIGWSAYTYLDKRNAIGITESSVQAEVPIYRADAVADALEIFAARRATFAQLEQPGTPVTTPSEEPEDSSVSTSTSTTSTSTAEVAAEPVNPPPADQVPDSVTPATSTEFILEEEQTPVLMN